MKRYFAFAGEIYYPTAGMGDFVGDFDSIDDAKAAASEAALALLNGVYETNAEKWEVVWAIVYDATERKNIWVK